MSTCETQGCARPSSGTFHVHFLSLYRGKFRLCKECKKDAESKGWRLEKEKTS